MTVCIAASSIPVYQVFKFAFFADFLLQFAQIDRSETKRFLIRLGRKRTTLIEIENYQALSPLHQEVLLRLFSSVGINTAREANKQDPTDLALIFSTSKWVRSSEQVPDGRLKVVVVLDPNDPGGKVETFLAQKWKLIGAAFSLKKGTERRRKAKAKQKMRNRCIRHMWQHSMNAA